jgi:uncharacterized membrane protein
MTSKRQFLDRIDHEAVNRAIRSIEAMTSGEICVTISPGFWGDVEDTARRAFSRLGIEKTRARNGVLLFIVPSRRMLAIIGDIAIRERVSDDFWVDVVSEVAREFARGEFTAGIILGVERVGQELVRHFPRGPTDVNEIPNLLSL